MSHFITHHTVAMKSSCESVFLISSYDSRDLCQVPCKRQIFSIWLVTELCCCEPFRFDGGLLQTRGPLFFIHSSELINESLLKSNPLSLIYSTVVLCFFCFFRSCAVWEKETKSKPDTLFMCSLHLTNIVLVLLNYRMNEWMMGILPDESSASTHCVYSWQKFL